VGNSFLYIEDLTVSRNQGLRAFRENEFSNIIAPSSINECKNIIESMRFKGAIIDFKLSEWVGRNSEKAIKLGNTECYNGIEIAEYLISKDKDIHIGLFSSYEPDLKEKLRGSIIENKIELVTQKNVPINNINKFLPDFLNKFYKLGVVVKPLFKLECDLPIEIQNFYNKKILNTKSSGINYWKAGNFSWIYGVNVPISKKNTEIENIASTFNLGNSEEKYEIGLNKIDSSISEFNDLSENHQICTKDIYNNVSLGNKDMGSFRKNKTIYDLFITKYVCSKFISNEFEIRDTLDILAQLSPIAKFESQKILFKEIQEFSKNEFKSKEEIYKILDKFRLRGFPKILDIYKGRVDSIKEKIAIVKLESMSPENVVRKEQFSVELIRDYNLDENAQFEYTIYKPSVGGNAFHIEPI
jgi:hypothetical protein